MYCSNCGKEVSEEERFCSGCGKALKETNEEKKKPLTNNMLIVGLCCVFAVLVVGIFAAGISFGKKDVPADGTTTSETTTEKEEEATTTTKATTTVKASQVTTKKPEKATTAAPVRNLPTDSDGIVKPDKSILGARYYVAPSDGLFLRSGPGTNYSDIMLLSQGTVVGEIGYRDDSPGWMLVRLMNGATHGWVKSEFLSTSNTSQKGMDEYYKYDKSFSTIVLAEDGLNLRTLPTENSQILGTISYKRTINVIGYSAYDPEWLYVSIYLDGKTQYGFVNDRYVQH